MNCNPTLTAEEFKTIHNCLYYLNCIGNEKVDLIVYQMREALKGAYKQDDAAFEIKNKHFHSAKEVLRLKHSEWSIYEVDGIFEEHPFAGADRVVYKDHLGNEPVQSSIQGKTWAMLWCAADECINQSGDGHHVFIEAFRPAEDDPRTLYLSTGS